MKDENDRKKFLKVEKKLKVWIIVNYLVLIAINIFNVSSHYKKWPIIDLAVRVTFQIYFVAGLVYLYYILNKLIKKYHDERHKEVKLNMLFFLLVEIIPISLYILSRIVM